MHVLVRLVTINMALWGHLLRWGLARAGVLRGHMTPAQRLASTLERLGTTFVKLGQGLSLHRELLPDDYVAELQKLQDHVLAFSGEVARAEIEASFGRPIGELFEQFDPQPMAAGSIAQVHAATMHDGRAVIVKVRRPGIRRQIDEDVRILRWFIASVLSVWPGLRALRPADLVDELARNLRKEIDFRDEAGSIARFAQMFRGSDSVYIPDVVDELYTQWVIVQEMSPGRHIDAAGLERDGPALAARLVDAYLRQLLVEGLFHGDPHPGNVFVLTDGRICLHDFGLVGYLDRSTRQSLIAFMLAFAHQDGAWLLDAYLELGMVAGAIDLGQLRRGIEELVQDYARKPLRDWSFGEILVKVTQLVGARNARVPHHLLVLMRTIFLLESTVRLLDPLFSLTDGLFAKAGEVHNQIAAPARGPSGPTGSVPVDRLGFEVAVAAREMSARLAEALHRLRADGVQLAVVHRGIEPLAQAVRTVGLWVSQALLALGLFVGASVLLQARVGPHWREVPVLPVIGYTLAIWLMWRLLRSERRLP